MYLTVCCTARPTPGPRYFSVTGARVHKPCQRRLITDLRRNILIYIEFIAHGANLSRIQTPCERIASVQLTRRGDRLDGKLTRAQRDQAGDAAGLAANSRPRRQALLEFLVADGLGKYIDHNHTGYN
jgi:hypothetical protein